MKAKQEINNQNLNTSHVVVQHNTQKNDYTHFFNLNTSHVIVQP